MQSDEELKEALEKLEAEGLADLRSVEPEYDRGWEIVRIEAVGEEHHIAYGFRAKYNDLIVGGLTSLETARALQRSGKVSSYAAMELERQLY